MNGITELAKLLKERENGDRYSPIFGTVIELPNTKIRISDKVILTDTHITLCINLKEQNSDGNYNTAFQNAVELTKYLMKELNIPLEKVVRHYDASRKNCPASMSKNGWALWDTFKKSLTINEEDLTMAQYDELKKEIGNIRTDVDKLKNKMVYAWVDDNMPDWAKPTVTKLMRKGYLKGDNEGRLMLDDNMLRILVINDRAGIYGNSEINIFGDIFNNFCRNYLFIIG